MQPPTRARHQPVLLEEVLNALHVHPGGHYIDGTLGAGGHAEAILQASAPQGRLLAFERDPAAIDIAQQRLAAFGERLHICHASYETMSQRASESGIAAFDGILLDLGLSSMQLADPSRGFSFKIGGPLDMRFGPQSDITAGELVNNLPEDELSDMLYRYGEERRSRRVARAIVQARPLYDANSLAEVISTAIGGAKQRIHPATRTFQALRIAVNDESDTLERTLPQTLKLLKASGRLAVISFHSLEDRIVKRFMREQARECVCPPRQPICTCGPSCSLAANCTQTDNAH